MYIVTAENTMKYPGLVFKNIFFLFIFGATSSINNRSFTLDESVLPGGDQHVEAADQRSAASS